MNKFENFKKDRTGQQTNERRQKDMIVNMDLFFYRNIKLISRGIVEFINNTVFHGLDTLKVRLQAKCLTDDVSMFYKNKVEFKRNFQYNFSPDLWCHIGSYRFVYSRIFFHIFK